jgi:hypothetical protein
MTTGAVLFEKLRAALGLRLGENQPGGQQDSRKIFHRLILRLR